MELDGLTFDNLSFYPLVDVIVRAKAYVRPRIFDVFIMRVVFKGRVFDFIGCRLTKNCMVLCKYHQDRF